MRSFGAAALFILAAVTECLGAQERSRQRSGPIRSVPVAADIKRDVDFDCPEEFGYYPHPTDCSLYYVCVFGGALLESCTGGLMYSHELQTCDWPRNVGCDGTSGSAVNEDIERLSEREPSPPPPPPRRTPSAPPPLPRVQPNPVVTSRGQPKFNRDEYEKQQQLYAEVDDLPPVEEIESDRQQRVYRGQPSTIGQVQKDRDGYGSQVVNSRTFNSNIIPASIPQNAGKIGSFSFGTQVEERRTPTATPAPQSYSDDKIDYVTDSSHDRHAHSHTNEMTLSNANEKSLSRRKRETTEIINQKQSNNSTSENKVSDRSDIDEVMEYLESDGDEDDGRDDDVDDMGDLEDFERGKRQIRYILKNNYKGPGKVWQHSKPLKFVDYQPYTHDSNSQSNRYQSANTGANKISYYDSTRGPYDNNFYSSANPFVSYQKDSYQSQRPFVPSFPDPFDQRSPQHAPMNVATQIITKSPPISSLRNNENPFSALAGGFLNNIPGSAHSNLQHNHNVNQFTFQTNSAINHNLPSQDSSLLPTTVVTGKPIKMATPSQKRPKYKIHPMQDFQDSNKNNQPQEEHRTPTLTHQTSQNKDVNRPSFNDEEYDDENENDEDETEEDNNSDNTDERDEDDSFYKHTFPKPPYEFTHPNHKYADIENPFADPNFDFDAFLSKLSNDHVKSVSSTTSKPKLVQHQNIAVKIINPSTESNDNSGLRSSSLNYDGMSTPHPFSNPTGPEEVTIPIQKNVNTLPTTKQPEKFQKLINSPHLNHQSFPQYQLNDNRYVQQSAGLPIDAVRPKLKPPNFNDDRQLPISYSFNRPVSSTANPNNEKVKGETKQVFTATQKPYIFISSTGTPMILSSPKQQYYVKPEKIITLQPQMGTGKQYFTISSGKPHNGYITIQQSTPKPLTTIANEQLSALQQFWKNLSTEPPVYMKSTRRPNSVSEMPNLESLFAQAIRSTLQTPVKQVATTTTTAKPTKRRPIPKPSPEMNDYYYEDDEELYEPPVKSKYMPSSEVKPQRPPMAQNYKEYDEDDDSEESSVNDKPLRTSYRRPENHRPETVTKNHNDVSVVTKVPAKESNRHVNGKLGVPVMLSYVTPVPNILMRPEVTNYEVHHSHRNRTMFIRRRPTHSGNGPHTMKPPKYLNQTTLRPYTVRHRLAKPTTVTMSSTESGDKTTRGRVRHHNIVAQMKLTTPRDNHNQETRYTKTRHDDKTNSLEPTESVTPPSYSASPRPKMLYNGTQNYAPDQYDPYYAVYDEDGELYKDTDYVQQYNTASLRPAVQQTYRGTPPPARRPVEAYTPRPTQEDYDDALIHGQINNQNQYQSAIRHSTRGEGNELGYDNPSNVKTTIYEAPTLSTTPSTTTSTSTTTQRPTSAPITEVMNPSRFTQRSSTDENPNDLPESSSKSPSDGFAYSVPATSSPTINFSSLAKPFEKTDNLNRLKDTLPTTETLPNSRLSSRVSNSNLPVALVRTTSDENTRKVVSLTTGFSIRRNSNNTNNPYTFTVLTRPYESYNRSWKVDNSNFNKEKRKIPINVYSNNDNDEGREQSVELKDDDVVIGRHSSESSMRRSDSSPETVSEENIKPVYLRPTVTKQKEKSRIIIPHTSATPATKYYLKTVIKRPAPFSANDEVHEESTENAINTEELIEAGLKNARAKEKSTTNEFSKRVLSNQPDHSSRSSYRSLDNYNYYSEAQNNFSDRTTSSTTTTPRIIAFAPRESASSNTRTEQFSTSKPSYFSYRVLDDEMPDHTTEIFSTSVKNIIKAFFNNFASTPKPLREESVTYPFKYTTEPEEKTVNIGFQKRPANYVDEKPLRTNEKRLQIISNPNTNTYLSSSDQHYEKGNDFDSDVSSTSKTTSTTSSTTEIPLLNSSPQTLLRNHENQPKKFLIFPTRETFVSKFNDLVTNKPETEESLKFHKLVTETPSVKLIHHDDDSENEVTKLNKTNIDTTKTSVESEWSRPISKTVNEIATTTSTTKSTVTAKVDSTSTTKSMSFPTRPSRVNPAIKAATNPGGGRRSYQSPSKCSSDNSLQQNPKCNEIKYQRPSNNNRGRGSAHYSTLSGDPPQQPNRGTPPTRSRPTLKPSTVIVTNSNPIVDIYTHPPRRPAPVYPQPTPDKTAAKCRKDVCLLPDCYCGGKDIPGDLPVESVPQIVLLTFDDSVNDLNKGLYADLFEKGRVNPNGCPISATFYVSHEWTDYSQVQNLYAAGHEIASHTISHSFGEQFSQKKWNREVAGQREILAAYGGVKLEDVRGMRAPFLSVGGNKMFKMLYDSNFTYDSSLPVYENRPPSWPYTLDYKLFHDCMIPPCPTKSYPGVWEVPMVMWQDLNGGRCSMGDACANPPEAEGVYKMLLKNFDRHYTTNRAPFGLFYHAAWFTQPHHKEGFIMFLDFINQMSDVWIVTNWQALQWVRDPTPISRLNNFQPFQCNYHDRPKKCNNPKVCNLWHKSGVRYMRTCQPCPEIYPWTGKTGIRSSRIDNDIEE